MTGQGNGLATRAAAWREADPDPETRAELGRLLDDGDAAALAERFEGSLAFGTAGIRAEMGAGAVRLNRLTAGRVAAGLAGYIAARDPAGGAPGAATGVVVGYDGRAKSQVFAADAARILSRAGVSVWLLPRALPTPVLAFAVRYLRAAYGVMVTASHNPRQDNGIKVYVADGGQLLPPADAEIAAAIEQVDPLRLPAGWAEGPFDFRKADDVVRAYVEAVAAGGPRTPGATGLKVVHTALHGVGDATLRSVLAAAGWPAPVAVAAQRDPDPGFPTVPYPNPEAPGVLDLARAAAERERADLVLANDPDADRLAVMVPSDGGWRALTGDELGALLGDAVLTRLGGFSAGGTPVVATTVVSGSLLRRMAQAAGVRCVTTLTGFKWIARAGGDAGPAGAASPRSAAPRSGSPNSGSPRSGSLVYGYEQALGYAVRPDLVADKDGISAALLVLEVAAAQAANGQTLADRLDDLALAHGVHVTAERSLRADGAAGLARLAEAVAAVRKEPPQLLAGQPVTVTDLLDDAGGVVDLAGGTAERAPGQPVPPADVLIWHAGGGARVMIRPSGTEPVIKIYAETVRPAGSRSELGTARAAAAAHAATLLAAAAAVLEQAAPAPATRTAGGDRDRATPGSARPDNKGDSDDGARHDIQGRGGPDDRPHAAGARGH
jgi:phosphomannomutase